MQDTDLFNGNSGLTTKLETGTVTMFNIEDISISYMVLIICCNQESKVKSVNKKRLEF